MGEGKGCAPVGRRLSSGCDGHAAQALLHTPRRLRIRRRARGGFSGPLIVRKRGGLGGGRGEGGGGRCGERPEEIDVGLGDGGE